LLVEVEKKIFNGEKLYQNMKTKINQILNNKKLIINKTLKLNQKRRLSNIGIKKERN
jgi:hypothetical protein